ncbi:MAG: hypothetical protein JEY91_04415 [Spirochaetaceae bacterium]|nr:hypothetical protein [Spirochaetaceae bacterium]
MGKKIKPLIILSPLFWFSLLSSISLRMLYWRTVNEPGINTSKYGGLLIGHYLTFSIGIIATVIIHFLIIRFEPKKILYAWIGNIVATILYVPLFLITLLMMA